MAWASLPTEPWVLHLAPKLGGLTDRWLDLQARTSRQFAARLLGAEDSQSASERHWLQPSDYFAARAAYYRLDGTRGALTRLVARGLAPSPPSVLHAHYGPHAAYHVPLARALGIPLVASFYGYDATKEVFRSDRRWRRLYGTLFDRASAVIVEGPAMAQRVQSLGCDEEKLRVIRLPADEAGLRQVNARRGNELFTVVIAGRLVEKKGFDTALEAFARALRGDEARLIVLGGGPKEGELRRQAEQLDITSQVEWMGSQPFGRFMAEISRADLALFPSRTARSGDSEGGAPVTLIEAQWLGIPAIVSDHDDLPFVTSREGSMVLPAEDRERWAVEIRSIASDRAALERMSIAARRFAQSNHSVSANLDARERLYLEVA